MDKTDRVQGHIQDILSAIALIQKYTDTLTPEEFVSEANILVQNLAMRQIGIIGEATQRLTKEVYESNPEIPWHEIAGMRNRLIHEYDDVDLQIVWQTITESLPQLKKTLETLRTY